jgi:hypothetical protein
VADKHYAMAMKSSFKKAISAGAKIAQVTFGVPAKVRQKVPTTLQDKGGNSETQEMHQQKTQQITGFVA